MAFRAAVKYQSYLRQAILGPAGSGKTPCSLTIATELARLTNTKIAVIDTETGSASKYKGMFDFDVDELTADQSPRRYVQAIAEAEKAGYGVLVIDSLSHAWAGREGSLERVDQLTADSRSKNSFDAWRHVSRDHNRLVMAVLSCRMHVVATMRVKVAYVMETNEKGHNVPRKVGMQPIMRDGVDYEFDIAGELDHMHYYYVSKSRCPSFWGNPIIEKPGADMAQALHTWLSDGEPMPAEAVDLERRLDQDESRKVYEERMRQDKTAGRQHRDRQEPKQAGVRKAAPARENRPAGGQGGQGGAPAAPAKPRRQMIWPGEAIMPAEQMVAILEEWRTLAKLEKADVYARIINPLEVRSPFDLPASRVADLVVQVEGVYQSMQLAPGPVFCQWRDRLKAAPPAPKPAEPHVERDQAVVAAQDAVGEENPAGRGDAYEGPDQSAGGDLPDETGPQMF